MDERQPPFLCAYFESQIYFLSKFWQSTSEYATRPDNQMCDTEARPTLAELCGITVDPAEIVAAAWKLAGTKPTKQASRKVSVATKLAAMRGKSTRDKSAVIRMWMREVQQIEPIGRHVVMAACEVGKSKILANRRERQAHATLLDTVLAVAKPLPSV